jgi:hypothetical protein
VLGDEVVKNVELQNPAAKPIVYWINIEGSTDFFVEEMREVIIPPKSSASLPVKFRSRISAEVSAKLSLTSRHSEGTAQAAAMVFDLKSSVSQRRSEETYEIEAYLYENSNKDIDIFNKFGMDAEFQIQIIYPATNKPAADLNKSRTKAGRKDTSGQTEKEMPKPFFIKNERIKVKKNSGNYISLQYLPFEMDNITAHIILTDERVGEL